MDNIFKKGDKVFINGLGWCVVEGETIKDSLYGTMITVKSDGGTVKFEPLYNISFTEYTLNGISQERPVNYDDWVGKWCKFWDRYHVDAYVIRKFKTKSNFAKFEDSIGVPWDNCEPLSELAIKELNL